MILPVIIAGGQGSRLWPLSTIDYPKQFLSLAPNHINSENDSSKLTMLQLTLSRLEGLKTLPPIIICNEQHRFIVAEQVRQLNIKLTAIILEPEGRGTAPAIALAALYLEKNNIVKNKIVENKIVRNNDCAGDNNEPVLLVLPADHLIREVSTFHDSVKRAYKIAEQGDISIFGVAVKHAETGFGYIKRANNEKQFGVYKVDAFKEKPNLKQAKIYQEDGNYLWNSGMFMLTSSCYLKLLKGFQPLIYAACDEALGSSNRELDFVSLNQQAFRTSPNYSIDVAIMEPLCNKKNKPQQCSVFVTTLNSDWNDMGTFNALWNYSDKDHNNNFIQGDIKLVNTKNCLIINKNQTITTVGIDNLVIVNTKDGLLITNKSNSEELNESERKRLDIN